MSKATKEQSSQYGEYIDIRDNPYNYVIPSREAQRMARRGRRLSHSAKRADEYSRNIYDSKPKDRRRAKKAGNVAEMIEDFQLKHLAKIG